MFDLWSAEADKPVSVEDKDWALMHAACTLFKEMLFGLDAAVRMGSPSDMRAADRLQRKLLHDNLKVQLNSLKGFFFGCRSMTVFKIEERSFSSSFSRSKSNSFLSYQGISFSPSLPCTNEILKK